MGRTCRNSCNTYFKKIYFLYKIYKKFEYYIIELPLANHVYIKQPNMLTAAVKWKTVDQSCVISNILPAAYTPKNPGIEPTVFIKPKTLPECFGAKSPGFTTTALLWKPVAPIVSTMQANAPSKLSILSEKKNFFCRLAQILSRNNIETILLT